MFYAMSDIHGCYNEFRRMLDIINFDNNSDIIFFCGDYIDRGNFSVGVVDYIRKNVNNPHMIFLKGNHEEEFISCVEILNSIKNIN